MLLHPKSKAVINGLGRPGDEARFPAMAEIGFVAGASPEEADKSPSLPDRLEKHWRPPLLDNPEVSRRRLVGTVPDGRSALLPLKSTLYM